MISGAQLIRHRREPSFFTAAVNCPPADRQTETCPLSLRLTPPLLTPPLLPLPEKKQHEISDRLLPSCLRDKQSFRAASA
jgi:hypothetical protein